MTEATIQSLLDECVSYGRFTPEYYQKMMHEVPEAPVVDRIEFILAHCKGKKVLNLGSCSGDLHDKIGLVSLAITGVDKRAEADIVLDLDHAPEELPRPMTSITNMIVAGEIIEHLSNPGRLLTMLRGFHCPLLVTVPNAFSEAGRQTMLSRNIENVNSDHVAWYSYWTLKTLVERFGFAVKEFAWYGGKPLTAEGLIFVVE